MNQFEWLSLWFFLAVLWIADFFFCTLFKPMTKYYSLKSFVIPKPPGWIFPLMWNILYPMIAVAIWLYMNWTTPNRNMYDAVLALALANYILNKAWCPLFFGLGWLWVAFVDALFLTMTAIVVLILLWVDTRDNGTTCYVAAGLYIPYVLWLIYATILNLDLAYNNSTAMFMYTEARIPGGKHPRSFWGVPMTKMPGQRGVVSNIPSAPKQQVFTPPPSGGINKVNVTRKGVDANVFYRSTTVRAS